MTSIEDLLRAELVRGRDVDGYLKLLEAPALRELLALLAARDPAVAGLIIELASSSRRAPAGHEVSAALLAEVDEALGPGGRGGHGRWLEFGVDAEELLDDLERRLDAGSADATRPALCRALTSLRTISEQAEDSAGALGVACQRAADLHARACREGSPDAVALARWLVGFRASSPGWPRTRLPDYLTAFDDEALAEYTAAVTRLRAGGTGADLAAADELDQMRLELADHRGDLDAAIEILAVGEHPRYGAVIDRLRDAGRAHEVPGWMDRAIEAGRVSNHRGARDPEYWLDPADVAATYRDAGRGGDAIAVLRGQFEETPTFAAFDALVSFAEPLGLRERERDWALAAARATAATPIEGAVLVEIALGEGDLDAAWAAADEFGAGLCWRELAAASAEMMPRRAADLHRPGVDGALHHRHTRRYPWIADELARMRELYAGAGADAEFAEYLGGIRQRHAGRRSLMAALAARGLI